MANPQRFLSLGERLAYVRSNNGLSQEAFAKKMGVSRSAYQHYERGEHEVPSSLLAKICVELDISPIWILLENGSDFARAKRKSHFQMAFQISDFVETRAKALGKVISEQSKREIVDIVADDFAQSSGNSLQISRENEDKLDNIINLVAA